jgi:mRNA interferase RelE/StbE
VTYSLRYSGQAVRNLKKLPPEHARAIYQWIGRHLVDCDNPRTVPTYKRIAGTKDGARYRVGSYRILVRIADGELVVEVVRVAHRSAVYRHLPDNL